GGGVLVGVGGLLGLTGMVLVGSALLPVIRQWVKRLEQPPSVMARRKWQQAKVAASAGCPGMAERTPDPVVLVLGKPAAAVQLVALLAQPRSTRRPASDESVSC
ncbi:MAG TPA: hypothetical protein VJ140_07075, partial [Actinomycetota bacterium]|nr:hypothetical protein [Actinomycetota bacterium]